MAIGDIYKMRIICYTDTQIGMNILWYKETVATISANPALALATTADPLFGPLYRAFMSPDATYRGLDVQLVSPTVGLAESTVLSTGVGSAGGTNCPQQVSGLIATKSVPANRSSRGRLYIPFPSTSFADANGYLTAGGQAALDAIVGQLTANINPPGTLASYVLQHRKTLAVGPPHTFTWQEIAFVLSRDRFATQRRRGQYGRQNRPPF